MRILIDLISCCVRLSQNTRSMELLVTHFCNSKRMVMSL